MQRTDAPAGGQLRVGQAAPSDDTAIADIDLTGGLLRLGGSRPIFNRMLTRFKDSDHDSAERIDLALRQRDWEKAHRLAHTLKGLAGTVGATALARQASEIEAVTSRLRSGATTPEDAALGDATAPDLAPIAAEGEAQIDDLGLATAIEQ